MTKDLILSLTITTGTTVINAALLYFTLTSLTEKSIYAVVGMSMVAGSLMAIFVTLVVPFFQQIISAKLFRMVVNKEVDYFSRNSQWK
jgi:hypothetical protein